MFALKAPAWRGALKILIGLVLASLASLTTGASALAASLPVPGSAAPALTLPSLDGPPLSLAALHGRPVVVHFFATWCEPCREELSGLSRLAAQLDPATGPVILAVDVGEVPVRVRRFLDRQFKGAGLGFPVLIDEDRALSRAFGVTVLPATLLLDPAHIIRRTAEGPIDWDHPDARAALDRLSTSTATPDAAALPPLTDREPPHDQPS
ncbi:TlpA disulfide reductase family protein [Ancylobacter sp. WKF20]|uniref:TlpA family protein disulfide reductase n=1 Tax=Ancylobacter sp. WKF20 TaxID=3039801 RepID=UPI002434317B|nr:TlpA disulfide reductase family protein [Ancylobacter sp. WKF20]WGD28807.1 TlpA disulfide reductase family protein [Ancylobacter sp. WKF20]